MAIGNTIISNRVTQCPHYNAIVSFGEKGCQPRHQRQKEQQLLPQRNAGIDQQTSDAGIRKRRVTFSTIGKARRHISLKDYTEEEIELTWYTQDDYVAIKKSVIRQIFCIESGEISKNYKYCPRGIEGHTKLGSISRSKARKESIATVLNTQGALMERARQQPPIQVTDAAWKIAYDFTVDASKAKDDDLDPVNVIAHRYCQITSSCQLWAMATGQADAREANFDI